MSARGLVLAAGLGLGLGLGGGCVEPEPEVECADAVVETEVFQFVASGHEFEDYCEAGFDAAESHAHWVAEAWGEPLDHRMRYRLFTDRDHECWPCSPAAACTNGNTLAAQELPHLHEIAHAAREGRCFTLIEEGWAVLYGDHQVGSDTEGDLLDALAAVDGLNLPGSYYGFAARFVAFLIETRGVDSLRHICTTSEPTRAGFEQAVIDEYGVTVEDLAVELDDYTGLYVAGLRRDQACFDELDDALVLPAEWTHDLDCGGPEVVGRRGVELWAHQTFTIAEGEAGIYAFEFSTESDQDILISFRIRSCAREGLVSELYTGALARPRLGEPDTLVLDDFKPGTYVMRMVMRDVLTELNDWTQPPPTIHIRAQSWL